MVGAIVAPSAIGIAVGGITFVTIGALAFSGGRTFCNTVCPVGATLSLASRKPMMRIQIDTSLCIGCRRCEAECKASCIDAKNHTVDMSRCVMCLDCIPACHDNAITYSPTQKKSLGTSNDGRRRFNQAVKPRRGRHACGKSRLRGKDYNRRQVSRQEKGSSASRGIVSVAS